MTGDRYRVEFDGYAAVSATDMFPDSDPTALEELLAGVGLDEFLFDWLFCEDLRVTVIDRVTGERMEWAGSWRPLSKVAS